MSHGTTRMRGIGFAALVVLAFAGPIARAEIKIDYSYVDKKSEAYNRFKGWVDTALAGNPGYEFSAIDAVTMFRLTNDAKYCDYAVTMMQKQADDATAAVAAGKNPEVAGDSYLQSGPMISALALTYDACRAKMTDAQRTQWAGYAVSTGIMFTLALATIVAGHPIAPPIAILCGVLVCSALLATAITPRGR